MTDRPLECSQCKKEVYCRYQELVGDAQLSTEMCKECPLLAQKLAHLRKENVVACPPQGLCCGNCHTPLEAIQMGQSVGCARCYEVFQEAIQKELDKSGRISPGSKGPGLLRGGKLSQRKPLSVEASDLPLSAELSALHGALNEALRKENYEEAAWLRDQIKTLSDPQEGK